MHLSIFLHNMQLSEFLHKTTKTVFLHNTNKTRSSMIKLRQRQKKHKEIKILHDKILEPKTKKTIIKKHDRLAIIQQACL